MLTELEKLIERSEREDEHKHDTILAPAKITLDPNAKMMIQPEGGYGMAPLTISEHALWQMCAKLSPTVYGKGSQKALPFDYFTKIDKDLLAENLNRHLSKTNHGSQWLVRGYDETVRAVLDGRYPGGHTPGMGFENTTYLKTLHGFLSDKERPDFKAVRPSVTADELHLKTVWRDVGDGGWGIGVYLGNSETGTFKLRGYPMIQRTSCSNSLIKRDEDSGFEFVHRGSFASLKVQFKAALGRILQASAELLDRMIEAESELIPDIDEVLDGICLERNWAIPVRAAVLNGFEGHQTRAALVNGVTFAAHSVFDDPNVQVDTELFGGELLYADPRKFHQYAMVARQEKAGLR